MNNLSPTEQCLCNVLSDTTLDPLQIAQVPLHDFLHTTARHGVQSLVYRKLQEHQHLHCLAPSLEHQLRSFFRQQTAVELQRSQIVQQIIGAFIESGVSSLLIKGEGLAHTVYTDPVLRARGDTDLFIAPCNIQSVVEIFRYLPGFRLIGAVYKKHQLFYQYRSTSLSGLNFDIHWRISNTARFARTISFDEALHKAVALPNITRGQTLCQEHALLLACMHLFATRKRNGERLIWYYDIHLLAQAMNDDEWYNWGQMVVAENIQDVCLTLLKRTASFFQTQLPKVILQTLAASKVDTSLSTRFYQSNLGLICNDLWVLSDKSEKLELLKELISPDQTALLNEYGKKNRLWIPLLYIVYIVTRVFRRLKLK